MLTIKVISRVADFQKLQPVWNKLLLKSHSPNIFLSWEWLFNWWEVFGKDNELKILSFFEDDRLVGLAPLYLRPRRLLPLITIKELLFLGTGGTVRSDYMDIICSPEYRRTCWETFGAYLLKRKDWDVATLRDVPEDCHPFLSHTFEQLRTQTIGEDVCYVIKMPASFDEYLSNLNTRMRRNIRNRRRNLHRDFTSVIYHRVKESAELDPWMRRFRELHSIRMRVKGLDSKFYDHDYERFHDRISQTFFRKGWLYAVDLELEGKMVAGRYNFIYDNKIYDYQTGFNPNYNRSGVMQALISYIIEDCIKMGVKEFDFLAGEEDYKRRFTNSHENIFSIRIFNRNLKGLIYFGLVFLRRFLYQQNLMKFNFLPKKIRSFFLLIKAGNYFDFLEAIFNNLKEIGIYVQINQFFFCNNVSDSRRSLTSYFTIREISKKEVQILLPFENKDRNTFLERWEKYGDKCRGIFYADELLGYTWLSFKAMRVPEAEYQRPLRDNEIYLYNVVVKKNWRKKGIFKEFYSRIIMDSVSEGKTIITTIDFTNYISKKAHLKVGFQEAGIVALFKLGNFWKHRIERFPERIRI